MRQKTADRLFVGAVITFVVALVAGVIWVIAAYFGSTREVTFTVHNESRSCTSKSCTNLIYTDHGVFKDSDSLTAGKFNSSDIYGELCPGGTFRVKVRGWRIPFLSEWPNILVVEQVIKQGPTCS